MPELEPEELALLDGRFASFAAAPTGALPGAGAARVRAAQRTRRARAALGGAMAAVLVLSAGVAVGAGGGDRDTVVPGPAASGAGDSGLQGALLDAEDVAAVRGGEWSPRPTEDQPFDPLPAGCGEPTQVFGEPAATTQRFLDGPPPYVVGHALKGYADEAQAEAALGRAIQAIESCGGATYQLQRGIAGSRPATTYATGTWGGDTVVFALERVGALLSGVAIRSFELDDAAPLADAAREEVSGGPFDAPEPAAQSATGLLTAKDAASVEPGAWTTLPWTGEQDLLTPCDTPTAPVPAAVAATDLRLAREAGGSFVYQQVFRYASAGQAAQALAARRAAVAACPQEPITTEPDPDTGMRGKISYDVIDTGQVPFVVRITTQCETCPPSYSYAAAVQVEDRLTVLVVALTGDGDPGAGLTLDYARVAAERLRGAG